MDSYGRARITDYQGMSNSLNVLAARAGVASRPALLSAGVSPAAIDRAVRAGQIMRVRRGWFALPNAEAEVVIAVRVGGSLTCVSALRLLGVWVPQDRAVHVSVPANASRLRLEAKPTVHWAHSAGASESSVSTVAESLATMAVCQPREETLVAIDWALSNRLVSMTELTGAFSSSPDYAQALLKLADRRHDSGLETMACSRLRALRIRFRVQVSIAGVGQVDVLIGECLVLELDGREFHSRNIDFDNDRRRDLLLTAMGYIVLRVSYRQVVEGWAEVERAILVIVRRRGHMRPRHSDGATV